ncbi:excisionase family DNA-binding protein [Georgenia subflava]|uniref:excisionase family DNA-binding protein n=1 Tax=Georgenia subflava TaxID=1622177 RepID=UPI00186ACB55|nr:excisionase family DNA-binding protein [Georgenia subflava]
MAELLPVGEAARRLGVTRNRVHQRIADGSLRAEKIGSTWLIDSAEMRPARVSRPMSPSMVTALVQAKEGAFPHRPSERARLKERLARIENDPVEEVPRLVSSWLASRARGIHLEVHPQDLNLLREDARIRLSGISDPRAGLASGTEVEGYINEEDLPGLAEDLFLSLDDQPNRPNVLLHVTDLVMEEVPKLFSAADLFDRGGPRETRAGLALLGRVS